MWWIVQGRCATAPACTVTTDEFSVPKYIGILYRSRRFWSTADVSTGADDRSLTTSFALTTLSSLGYFVEMSADVAIVGVAANVLLLLTNEGVVVCSISFDALSCPAGGRDVASSRKYLRWSSSASRRPPPKTTDEWPANGLNWWNYKSYLCLPESFFFCGKHWLLIERKKIEATTQRTI